jgi:hypothetical protein
MPQWIVVLTVALIAGVAKVTSAYIDSSGSSYSSQGDACDKTLAAITKIINESSLPAQAKEAGILHAQNAYICCEKSASSAKSMG